MLRFVVTADDGAHITVEMRGQEIRGVLDDGDRVALIVGSTPDGVHRPLKVQNQTTGSAVTAWRPSLAKRAAKPLITTLTTAVISSAVTLVVGLLSGGQQDPAGAAPGFDGGGTDLFPFELPGAIGTILVISAILWAVWFALLGWRRRRRGQLIWPVAAGIVVGVAIGLWAFAVSDGSITIGFA